MNNNVQIMRGHSRTLLALCVVLFATFLLASCGGGASAPTSVTSPSSSSGALILTADPGPVCETQLAGASFTIPIPNLSCNGGSNPNMAYLDGSKSTASDGSTLSYTWSFVSRPAGSTAVLNGANTAKPTFLPDKAGPYRVQLVVSANGVTSPRAVAQVDVLDNATITTFYKYHGGLSSNCAVCHTNSFPVLPDKPSTHIASSNMCQGCHSPAGFAKIGFVDHQEVFGKCSDCHDGVTATGKSNLHIPTTQECSDCHKSTIHFVPLSDGATFDHSTATEPCSACHNGTIATGTDSDPNPTGHPSITTECNACHTTTTFSTPFPNHADPRVVVPGTCGSAGCHDGSSFANGAQITGENSAPHPHIDTGSSPACDLCHNTTSYNMGGVFSHSVLGQLPSNGITVSCSTCHDGLNATGVPAPTAMFTHPNRTDCENCHSTAAFKPALTVDHTGFDPATKDCATGCHDGTNATGMPTDSVHNTATNPNFDGTTSLTQCGQCHTPPGGSFHTATVDHSAGVFGTLGNPLVDCTSCHDGNIPTAQGKPGNHFVTTDNCGNCHSPQAPSFVGGIVDHSTIVSVDNGTTPPTATPTCDSCHGSTATGQSLTHVPMTAASGTDCVVCHGTGYSSFTMTTFDHDAAGITSNCVSCHDGKTHDTTLVVSKAQVHIPTTDDCSNCHTDKTNGPGINGTPSSGFATATRFVNTVHPAYTTGCRTCHSGTYTIYNAKAHPNDSVHATVDTNGWECKECHTTTGNFLETNPVNHADPNVKAQACISCHDGNTPGATAKGPTHPSTSDQCQGCHQAGGSFTAGFDHTTLDIVGNQNYQLACTTCHDGLNATGKAQNHMPTTRDCISCHAGHPPTVADFANGTFDHTGPEMTGRLCMDCHDGSILGAKSKADKPDHKVTSADCGACHSTTAFKPATSFDHTGVTSGCQSSGCHTDGNPDVMDVTDDPNRTHIPIMNGSTEVDCYNCHKSPGGTFANATMDHTVVTFEACEACHGKNYDGANTAHLVTPKPSNHFVTSIAACASCHKSTSAWTVAVRDYTHTGSGYPGNHSTSKVTQCSQCHTDTPANSNISTFPDATYGSTCAVCHWQTGQREHGNPLKSDHYDCGRSGCHSVSKSSFNK